MGRTSPLERKKVGPPVACGVTQNLTPSLPMTLIDHSLIMPTPYIRLVSHGPTLERKNRPSPEELAPMSMIMHPIHSVRYLIYDVHFRDVA